MMYRLILKIGLIVLVVAAFSAPRAHAITQPASAGNALLDSARNLTKPHRHACRWHLTVTGGQTPNSSIVLHLTNSCVNNGGPQVVKRVGVI